MTRLIFSVGRVPLVALVVLITISTFSGTIHADNPPTRCAGYGNLQSISLTNWDSGLGPWTADTHHTAGSFNTPDWAVVGSLPESREGQAAFAANLNSMNLNSICDGNDGSGALTWIVN